jgi:hypothetical protein
MKSWGKSTLRQMDLSDQIHNLTPLLPTQNICMTLRRTKCGLQSMFSTESNIGHPVRNQPFKLILFIYRNVVLEKNVEDRLELSV